MVKVSILVSILLLFLLIAGTPSLQANWAEDGIAVTAATGMQWLQQIITDGAGGAIITWTDERGGEFNRDIYAQRVDSSGDPLWTTDGAPICTADSIQWISQLAPDGAGGAIITWYDHRLGDPDIYAQRIGADGNVQWAADGIAICAASLTQCYPEIIPDTAGGAIITWEDWRNGEYDIYAQRIDAEGNVQWAADGVAICTAAGYQSFQQIIPDTAGGAIIVWQDTRRGYPDSDIYAQRIGTGGAAAWTADGVGVCTFAGAHYAPKIIPDDAGGAIIAWTDIRSGNYDVYAQRINENGDKCWTADGVAICALDGVQWFPQLIPDGSGGAIITWTDGRGDDNDIYAQRIDADGNLTWTAGGVAICTATMDQGNDAYGYGLHIASDSLGGAVITWQDLRNWHYEVYAQRIDSSGNVQWESNGKVICSGAWNSADPRPIPDGKGGTVITWMDDRSDESDIYATKINQQGEYVATLLQSYSASFNETSITVRWTLSESGRYAYFFVLRAESEDGAFEELPAPAIENEGLSFSFRDESCEPGTPYRYRIEVRDEEGRRALFETRPIRIPAMPLSLFQNNPNPFNPSTTIGYYLPEGCRVILDIYDTSGRLIARLDEGGKARGHHKVLWRGLDDSGDPVASGVYLYRIKAGKETLTRKMVLLK